LLSPLLYSIFTHDCVTAHDSNTIIKLANNTTVVGLITDDNETGAQDNNLSLNISETKELIVEMDGRSNPHSH
jgi:hypothetical protein